MDAKFYLIFQTPEIWQKHENGRHSTPFMVRWSSNMPTFDQKRYIPPIQDNISATIQCGLFIRSYKFNNYQDSEQIRPRLDRSWNKNKCLNNKRRQHRFPA
ncbi:hypothetical protein RF11_15821 [Thelohanellus kitauei]|uniref:Uncharacterized protein n=1 Tax=Thelohanellus kitauei TaxID=669202 RepID=A0A0C2JZD1_THEKT|nr:hypothetical protein RF11_15821 [Thelohanellus kitauei]